ncbi:MAG: hypothetical protein ACI4RO_01370 [Candidatus Scatosoma sp.]
MKKGRAVSFFSALALLATAFFSVACAAENEKLNNIEVGGEVYIDGEQTVLVSGATSAMGDAPAVFLSEINTTDITLGGAAAGKTVESVSFVSSDEIRLVLSGKAADFDGEYAVGKLTVSARALEGNKDAFCLMNVCKPRLSAKFSMASSTSKIYSSTFVLPYGSFTAYATAENISLVDPSNGTLTKAEVNDGKLTVTVNDYDSAIGDAYPLVRIPANATTFNVAIEAYVGKMSASYPLG